MDYQILLWLQQFHVSWLIQVMEIITLFGEASIALIVVVVYYFLIDKETGKRCIIYVCGSFGLNALCKGIVRRERPINQPGITSYRTHTATGTSFPSGHTQSATTLALVVHRFSTYKRWQKIGLVSLALLVGFSRLYLGVHWPSDVVGGILLAFVSFYVYSYIMQRLGFEYTFLVIAALMACIYTITKDSDVFKLLSAMCGGYMGMLWDTYYFHMENPTTNKQRCIRLCIIASVGALAYIVTKVVFPGNNFGTSIRYFLVGLSVFGGVPGIIKRFKL